MIVGGMSDLTIPAEDPSPCVNDGPQSHSHGITPSSGTRGHESQETPANTPQIHSERG